MNLEKILYTISVSFFTIFILSAIFILTNTLNMWLVGIVSLLVSVIVFIIMKFTKKKNNKGE